MLAFRHLLKQKSPCMKQALIFILSILSLTQANHDSSLCLLKVSSGFKEQILDPAVNGLNERQSLVLIRVRTVKNGNNSNQYKFTVFTLTPKELQYFYSASDNYQGYFIYRQCTVLIYGDDVTSIFFEKTNKRKHFSFLSAPKTNPESTPPFGIEPVGYSYISIDGKWKVSD